MVALTARALIAMAQGEPEQAERDAHDALAIAAHTQGYLRVPDTWSAWPDWRPTTATTSTRRACWAPRMPSGNR